MRRDYIKKNISVTKAWNIKGSEQINGLFVEYPIHSPSLLQKLSGYLLKTKLNIEGRFFGRGSGGGLPSDDYPVLVVQIFVAMQLLYYFKGMAEEAGKDSWHTLKRKIIKASRVRPKSKSVKKWGKPNFVVQLIFKNGEVRVEWVSNKSELIRALESLPSKVSRLKNKNTIKLEWSEKGKWVSIRKPIK